ncbi:hypothetical protein C0993_001459, partial [Termitomyces sp. T159_Od127]
MELIPVAPELPADPVPHGQDEHVNQDAEVGQQQLRRSARVSVPTARSKPDEVFETATQRAVRESRESADRIREEKAERRRAIEELHHGGQIDPQNNANEDPNLNQVLAIINKVEDTP